MLYPSHALPFLATLLHSEIPSSIWACLFIYIRAYATLRAPESNHISQIILSPVIWGNRIRQLHRWLRVKIPPTGPPVGHGWRHVMFKDGTLVAEQPMTCNTPPWHLLELDGRSERPTLTNRLVTSSPSTYDCPDPIALIANPQPF